MFIWFSISISSSKVTTPSKKSSANEQKLFLERSRCLKFESRCETCTMIQESLLPFKKIYSRLTKELNTPEERNFKVFPDRRNSCRFLSREKLATVKFIVQCSFLADIVVFCMCQLFLNALNDTFYIHMLIKPHSWKYNSNTQSKKKDICEMLLFWSAKFSRSVMDC